MAGFIEIEGQRGDDSVHRRVGLDGHRRLDALRADKAEDFGAVGGDFLMNRDGGRACPAEGFDVFFGLVEHEVHIQRDGEALMERSHNAGAEAEVRHEMPVHDVYMNPVCARGNHAGSGGFEVENIGSEDGRGYNHGLTLRVVDWIQFIMQNAHP